MSFTTLDGEPYISIRDVDRMAPFLMNIVSNGECGSSPPVTRASRRDGGIPTAQLFPYQTADKLLRLPHASGVTCLLCASARRFGNRGARHRIRPSASGTCTSTSAARASSSRKPIKRSGCDCRWRLGASDEFGLVRQCTLENIGALGRAGPQP